MFKFFDLDSEWFTKCGAFCSHIFDHACLRCIVVEEVRNYKKLYLSKTILKMAGGGVHAPNPTPLDPPLTISYENHQKSLAYFNNLTDGTINSVLFYYKTKSKGGGGGQHNAPLNTLLTRRKRSIVMN